MRSSPGTEGTDRGATALRVLHVNDAAFTTTVLMGEARRRRLPWRYLPLATMATGWSGAGRVALRALKGARWEAHLALLAASSDLLHVHVASVVRHTGWVPRPYVLHLHGTDVRTHQYDPRLGSQVLRAIARAAAVAYSTPDLAPHVGGRPDATLIPVPIDTAALPAWRPEPGPRVVFSSRWDVVKGLPVQLAVARRLAGVAEVVGVDWGPGADAAREAGVRLVPRSDHAGFLRFLASAHVVVGQPTGMLAASELEAIGIGVPVVAPLHRAWYSASGAALPPVLGGTALDVFRLPPQDPASSGERPLDEAEVAALADGIADETLASLRDSTRGAMGREGLSWLRREHGAAAGVDRVLALYDQVMERRS